MQITVADTRPASEIAAEITRRLLPRLDEAFVEYQRERAEEEARAAKRRAALDDLLTLPGAAHMGDQTVRFGARQYAVVKGDGSEVSLSLDYVPAAVAKRMLAIMQEACGG